MDAQTQSAAGTKITGIDLSGATVSDVPRSIAFYRDTLGMVPSNLHEQGAEFELSDGTTFGLWNPGDDSYPTGFGVMFAVADARAALELFRSRGAKVLMEPFDSPVCVMAMIADPDGNRLILHQRTVKNDPVPPPHVNSQTSVNRIDWTGYHVKDAAKAVEFYRDVLGLTPTYVYESGMGAEFGLDDGNTFGVWAGTAEKAGKGAFMLGVTDAVVKVAQLRERGLEISDADDLGDCFMAHTKDPDGIDVIIHQRKGD